jgi:hypothetical protein
MPHHVYAAKGKCLVVGTDCRAVREVSARSAIAPYRLALRPQRALDLAER